MALFLERYLTEYDDSLSAASYLDPVGTLIIWSAYGRQVFNNRVNSVSNDVRNYTLNLFHHYLIRQLLLDDEAPLSGSLQRKYLEKDTLHFRQACLVLLENLFVYSVLQHERMDEVETVGILGISKARRRWEQAEGKPALTFTHEPAGQILVRQLGLGVSGRYKTPLVEIGFFDANYHYSRPSSQPRWEDAQEFFTGKRNTPLAKLARAAYEFLKECASQRGHGAKLEFVNDVPAELTKAYARAFASPRSVGSYARTFWLQQSGLDTGAAGALYKVLAADAEGRLGSRQVLEHALTQELQPDDRARLWQIAQLEPFLSDCVLLFTLMAAERTHSIADVATHWERSGRDASRLPGLARQLEGYESLPAVKGSEAAGRLVRLKAAANAGDFEQQVCEIARFHAAVMQSRGQPAWLSIDPHGAIKVNARTLTRPAPETWPPGAWYNQYYLPQFRALVTGLEGVEL